MSMTKPQFIDLLSKHLRITKTDAERFLDGLHEVVFAALKAQEDVIIPHIVRLRIKNMKGRPERTQRNALTGQTAYVKAIPPHRKLKARAAATLKKKLGTE